MRSALAPSKPKANRPGALSWPNAGQTETGASDRRRRCVMRRFTTLIGTLALAVAACGGAASPTKDRGARDGHARSDLDTCDGRTGDALPGRVHRGRRAASSGETCTYSGPSVVPHRLEPWSSPSRARQPRWRTAIGAALPASCLRVLDERHVEQVLADTANAKQTDTPAWAVIHGAGFGGALAEVEVLYRELGGAWHDPDDGDDAQHLLRRLRYLRRDDQQAVPGGPARGPAGLTRSDAAPGTARCQQPCASH